jgi:hypothetical protein
MHSMASALSCGRLLLWDRDFGAMEPMGRHIHLDTGGCELGGIFAKIERPQRSSRMFSRLANP